MKLNSIILSRILIGVIVSLIVLTGVGYYFAAQFLRKTTVETSHMKTDASLSEANILKLKRLESELSEKRDVVIRAEQIVGESGQYRYQDQIVRDINTYAARAGVRVIGYNFGDASKPAVGSSAQKNTSLPTVKGVKAISADVSMATPIKYDNFLRFLKAIEQNLTKMQITGVNMVPDKDDPNAISNPSVGLQIYIKE